MSANHSREKAAAASAARPGRTNTSGGAKLGQEHSAQARRWAAALLEVLAGTRTPSAAATALGVSLPRYYQMESRAVRGLVAACEPQPTGRGRRPESEVTALRQQTQRLQRELSRQQALVRVTQRTVGLAPPPAPAPAGKGKKKTRRRVARALSLAARLQPGPDVATQPVPAAVPATTQ